jgi:glycosyltransferase involved in cell wall biosynthesis
MNILFMHQNFPGQFVFLAPALVQRGHNVVAMTMQKTEAKEWRGVKLVPYSATRGTTPNVHPWVADFETKTIRAEASFRAGLLLKQAGFTPDIVIAHPGWGESLFIKELWPQTRLGIYCEFFYHAQGVDVGFDAEFPVKDPAAEACRLRLKNLNNLLHFDIADAGISPTHWQASTFPEPFRSRITVVHDGIDTRALAPQPGITLTLNGTLTLSKQDEVITFVNRNLEPYRGYHIFMRALPEILKQRPKARVLIVGADDVSYGARPTLQDHGGEKWKDIFIAQVRPQLSQAQWERVHFLGKIPYQHFVPLLQVSTVHVYLTYPFVLSWSLLEAMSVGCAIVASDTAPLHEAIHHNETGRLVNFFDVSGLANEVCMLLDNPQEQARLGRNARQFAQQHYDLNDSCLPRQLAWVDSI